MSLFFRSGDKWWLLLVTGQLSLGWRKTAKRAGRQTYRCFEPRMNDELARFIQTRDALRDALERQEFVLHYQPQVALDTGRTWWWR